MILLWLATGVLAKPSEVELPLIEVNAGGWKRKKKKETREEIAEVIEAAIENKPRAVDLSPILYEMHSRFEAAEMLASIRYMKRVAETQTRRELLSALLEQARLLQEEEEAVSLLLLH